jgi:hypothetical protein
MRIELFMTDETKKAVICHVCGSYVCPKCENFMEGAKPISPFPVFEGKTSRLYSCVRCDYKRYLVVRES